jgi:hypothetical protein
MGGGSASVAGLHSLGGATRAHPTPDIKSTSTTKSSDPVVVPLVQPDISSAISVLEDSSLAPSIPSPIIPAPLSTPILTIKDKASDLGLKDITNKDSWIDTKKIIDAHLRRPPYCPGPDSKVLVTTKDNQVVSSWWEEVINFYIKHPISNLFVEESQFDGKGFEMIKHIDKYFNSSGTVDSLSHIFDLINVKQASVKSMITLKA